MRDAHLRQPLQQPSVDVVSVTSKFSLTFPENTVGSGKADLSDFIARRGSAW
ncbi:hypothetical protein OK016_29150 [Vibrio chagasii]|nr:hypothetical protein [Vibrio chagasii]